MLHDLINLFFILIMMILCAGLGGFIVIIILAVASALYDFLFKKTSHE